MPEAPLAPSAKPTAPTGFGAMCGVIIPACDSFFEALGDIFKIEEQPQYSSTELPALSVSSFREEVLSRFLMEADRFAARCCLELASVIRENSTQNEVRETAEPVLARLIRNRCFETLDNILSAYLQLLREGKVKLDHVIPQLADSRVKEAFQTPISDTDLAAASQNPKPASLIKIWEYFTAFEYLPQELMDYGGTKLFGIDLDFNSQKGFAFNVKEAIQGKWQHCITVAESFEPVKQKIWEEQRVADQALIKEAALNSILKNTKRKGGFGLLAGSVVCFVVAWLIYASGIANQNIIMAAISFGAVGIILFFAGVVRLMKD